MSNDRIASRILLLDQLDATLLFEGIDTKAPESPPWWFTPGGGVEPGETLEAAARRELQEETGLIVDRLVGPLHQREVSLNLHGEAWHQTEHFFAARIERAALIFEGWTELERRAMLRAKWWTLGELRSTNVGYYPSNLPELIERASAALPKELTKRDQ